MTETLFIQFLPSNATPRPCQIMLYENHYLIANGYGAILQIDLDGTNPSTFLEPLTLSGDHIFYGIVGLCLSADGTYFLIADYSGPNYNGGYIGRINPDGSNFQYIFESDPNSLLSNGYRIVYEPTGICLSSDKMHYLYSNAFFSNGYTTTYIVQMDLDFSNPVLFASTILLNSPGAISLSYDSAYYLITNTAGNVGPGVINNVYKLSLDGTTWSVFMNNTNFLLPPLRPEPNAPYPDDYSSGISAILNISPNNYLISNWNFNSIFLYNYHFVCFKEDTKILTDKGYVMIQNLRKGNLIKTLKDGFVSLHSIGYTKIYNQATKDDRLKDILYVCCKEKYPELDEDLIITGCHSILVDEFKEDEEKDVKKVLGKIYVTDGKFRLPACVDKRTNISDIQGIHTIYHIALDNENYYYNYGIYANGLLVESCSKRYLNECSKMTII